MSIALVHTQKAFLPELEAYHRFFSAYGIACTVVHKNELPAVDRKVEWFMMGTDFSKRKKGILRIHEFASPSVPPLHHPKDLIKRHLLTKPDLRLFLNPYVRKCLSFHDGIPYGFRDMGIHHEYLHLKQADNTILPRKEFDFIYVGDLSPQRRPIQLLQAFTQPALQNKTLLLLSSHYEALQKEFQAYSNIIFKGPVSRSAVKDYILRSHFGLNYMPNAEPFNQLTSTKLLEYAACGVPIISTDYAWIRQFKLQYGGNYLLVKENLEDLDWEKAMQFNYQWPDLGNWTWEQQIRHSGVLQYLQPAYPEIQF